MGEYTEMMKRPLLKEIRDDLGSDDYASALGKWKWLNLKAKRSKKFGRDFPETVIDMGLVLYGKAIDLCIDDIERDSVDRDYASVVSGMNRLSCDYITLIFLKLENECRNPHDNDDRRRKVMQDVENMLNKARHAASLTSDMLSGANCKKGTGDGMK